MKGAVNAIIFSKDRKYLISGGMPMSDVNLQTTFWLRLQATKSVFVSGTPTTSSANKFSTASNGARLQLYAGSFSNHPSMTNPLQFVLERGEDM